jgi:AraC family transcriptional regulator
MARLLPLLHEATLGRTVREADARGFSVLDVSYPAGAALLPHAHDRTYVSFVLRGSFAEESGRSRDIAESATVVLMPAGVHHSNRIGAAETRSLVIALEEQFERRLTGGAALSQSRRWILRGAPVRVLADVYQAFRMSAQGELEAIEELLFAFADAVRETPDPMPARECVARALERLHDDPASPVSARELAASLGVDPAYLCRAFRRSAGCTMSEYVRQLRTKKAAHLIASTEVPLADVALRCGFADQSHLTRVFKHSTGMPPQAYRAFAREQ